MSEYGSASWRIDNLKVNGKVLKATFGDNISEATLRLSTTSEPALSLTIIDTPDLALTSRAAEVFHEGSVFTWGDYVFGLNAFTTGGGTEQPVITVEATSDVVRILKDEKGGKNWDSQSVSAWMKEQADFVGANLVCQPDLGERTFERAESEDDPEGGDSTWDVMAEVAKQVGAWVYDEGDRLVLGKPAWLAARTGINTYPIVWNSLTDHTDALVAIPEYTWDKDAKTYDGREKLVIRAMDPGPGTFNAFAWAVPGEIVDYSGTAAVSKDPRWLIVEIEHSLTAGSPVVMTCWRPIDPPEKKEPTSADSGGSGTAGVPDGPIGDQGWNGEQLKNASLIVAEAQRRDMKMPIAAEIAVMTAMQESSLINKDHGDEAQGVTNPDGTATTSKGLFQQQNLWGSISDRMNPAKSAGLFYDRLAGLPYEGAANNATRAGQLAQQVQGSAHPEKYAVHYSDAKKVVAACIAAGKTSGPGAAEMAPGELGKRIRSLVASYNGQRIDVDGSFGAQCYDLAQKYLTDLTGIGLIGNANGHQWWRHPALTSHFHAIKATAKPRQGDIGSWAPHSFPGDDWGAGHVAIYSHYDGGHWWMTQNPGASHYEKLPHSGLQGFMRPRAKGE